ncbi:SGNH/GDSL hydrolase family protein [Pseudochelatococcus contaminans]|uniref:Lysophospholipase L1-like esterase n=1 Tax=Pseudochelatococcus contaminans TaxID=1538103 RepID=A0A7W5Z6E7_9HYPH|nr:SGNH/GDSL hydrolase family protein [Pseudochelatococcus contaminans]MBB3810542.1 lysophospholipase L1-like esterase [Pseudochelatococcus contaminans]
MHAYPFGRMRCRWSMIAPRGLPPYSRTTKTLMGLGVIAVAGVALAWTLIMPEAPKPRDGYALVRLRTVEAQAEQIEGDYILLAGDSHVERLYLPQLCGLPTLNAGLSGATLAEVVPFLTAAKIRPPKLVLISVGTNDAHLKRAPNSDRSLNRFRRNFDELLSIPQWEATPIVISQVPPLRETDNPEFSATAIAAFNAIENDACDAGKCRRIELFPQDWHPTSPIVTANVAEAPGPLTSQESFHAPDGIHINRLTDRILAKSDEICGALAN